MDLRPFAKETVCGPVDNVEDCDGEGWQQIGSHENVETSLGAEDP